MYLGNPRPWIRRLVPLFVACAVAGAVLATTFPVFVLHYGVAEPWGEFVVGPCLLTSALVGMAGAVAPKWWTGKRAFGLSLLGIVFFFALVRHAHPGAVVLPSHPIGERSP